MKKPVKIALICLVAAIMITAIVLINFTELGVVKLNKLNGDRGMFDTMMFKKHDGSYKDYAYSTMFMMKSAGIRQHLIIHLIDYVFIMSYFILMTLAAIPFLKGKYQLLAVLVPTGLVLADLIENITIDAALLKFPQRMDALYITSNVFGWIKWCMLVVWVAFMAIIIAKWFIEKRKQKTNLPSADEAADPQN